MCNCNSQNAMIKATNAVGVTGTTSMMDWSSIITEVIKQTPGVISATKSGSGGTPPIVLPPGGGGGGQPNPSNASLGGGGGIMLLLGALVLWKMLS